ncbi:MAG: DegT/DnrJ/EryC1/StrS family aminotransferase [Candidatus Omnitrophica bacterium]|nr:DegT/DnrJ/EryC1/StrS family aminotransferase [Candidatus Omnitrophota bacterium]
MTTIPHSCPTIDRSDFLALEKPMASGQVSAGPCVKSFESAFAAKFDFKDAAAVSSGTAALHLSLLALGVKKGDEVVLPSYVCPALLNAISYTGAMPKVADVDYEDGNISCVAAKAQLTRKTKAIIVPHMFGEPADLQPLLSLGVPVIEDCAQAIGARYRGKYVGSFGVLSVFSFYATKMMTTGEGGMVVSADKRLMARVRDMLSYDHHPEFCVRFNNKMTDLQAALGCSQLKKLDKMISLRRSLARLYSERLKGLDMTFPFHSLLTTPVFYRYVVKISGRAQKVITGMKKRGINCERPLYKPVHQYLKLKGFPVTENLMKDSISLPIYPSLSFRDALRVVKEFYQQA